MYGDNRPMFKKVMDALAIPRVVRLAFAVLVLDMLLFTAMRSAFYYLFNDPQDPMSQDVLIKSFYIGMKFDLRLSLLMVLPIVMLGAWGKNWLFRGGRFIFTLYLLMVHLIAFSAYAFDFGHYAYLSERLNATALRFLYNFKTSAEMIWQTYPVPWIGAGLAVFIIIIWMVLSAIIGRGARYRPPFEAGVLRRWVAAIICAALIVVGIYGKYSSYPLRWSDAYFNPHKFSSDLALNPLLYFSETLGLRAEPYNLKKAKAAYPHMASYLGVDSPDPEKLNYLRTRQGKGPINGRPNVIVVLLESFVSLKTGVFGNPLDPTPNFDKVARDGILFRRFYVPSTGTARSVFTLLTGLPDVESRETSSRNPLIVKQNSIVTAFEGYDKLYFLGGSVNWANIRGLLGHNIPNIEIYEEGSYDAPDADVWGISDLNLFVEASNVLAAKGDEKPFFAIIQTSGNHRPYTIPDDNRGFEYRTPESEEYVKKYGFTSIQEYNSFRFMDHSIGVFMQEAASQPYFDNTVFVFLADHGLPGSAAHIPKSEMQLGMTQFHVPFVIHAPGLIKGGMEIDTISSEVDVLATVASLTSTPYKNTTLGRDIFSAPPNGERYAFTISGQSRTPEIGLVSKDFYYKTLVKDGRGTLHEYDSQEPRTDVSNQYPEIARRMEEMVRAFYESARYIRYFNKPE